jgi:hypothetical protein
VTGRHSNQLNYQSSIEGAKIDDFHNNSKPFSNSEQFLDYFVINPEEKPLRHKEHEGSLRNYDLVQLSADS